MKIEYKINLESELGIPARIYNQAAQAFLKSLVEQLSVEQQKGENSELSYERPSKPYKTLLIGMTHVAEPGRPIFRGLRNGKEVYDTPPLDQLIHACEVE